MNKYDSFEIFMVEVVNKANTISNLNDLFDVKYEALVSHIEKIIKVCGWWAFVALCALLALGPFAFGATLGGFLLTPVGIIVGGVLGIAAATIIRQLYRNRGLPLAIKRVGSKYENKWKEAHGSNTVIDSLFKDAVSDLLHSGKHTLSDHALSLLASFSLFS